MRKKKKERIAEAIKEHENYWLESLEKRRIEAQPERVDYAKKRQIEVESRKRRSKICPNCKSGLQYPYTSCSLCEWEWKKCEFWDERWKMCLELGEYVEYDFCRECEKYKEEVQEQEEKSRYISASVRREVWRRDQGRCVECGSKERLEYDHIIPFSKGGSNTARNIQLLCEKCNRTKYNQI